MWIFAQKGFVSIVEDAKHPGNLLVRGRVKGDVEALFPWAKVTVTPDRDYRFRASVGRAVVEETLVKLVREINYDNFKNSTPGDRHAPYMDVWTTMYRLQAQRTRPKKRRNIRYTEVTPSGTLIVGQHMWPTGTTITNVTKG